MKNVLGTQGYATSSERQIEVMESVAFDALHDSTQHLLPARPSRLLDLGAGSGRDAAHLAELGHEVVAVEPFDPFREAAQALHPSPRITWIDDALPSLARLTGTFAYVQAQAVWMHLDEEERELAMPRILELLERGGLFVVSLRHGPVPPGKRMFDVRSDETVDLAERFGFEVVLHLRDQPSAMPGKPVTWTRFALRRR